MKAHLEFGFVTREAEKLAAYFPTADEPDLIPSEPPFTPDDQLVVDYLRGLGHRVAPIVWGETPARLNRFDRVVMRSPWDFMDNQGNRKRFVSWVRELATADIALENSARLMLWLLDKSYLGDFEAVGGPIVPTRFLRAGARLEELVLREPAVLKPAVSGAGQGLFFLEKSSDLERQGSQIAQALLSDDYLIQVFIPEIRSLGEWSLVYLDGSFSHAVHKLPGPDSILVQAELGGSIRVVQPPEPVVHFADQVLASLGAAFVRAGGQESESPLYLRVDVIPTVKGGFLLSECEGVEPELFFRVRPGSQQIFAKALVRRCRA